MPKKPNYALKAVPAKPVSAPDLPYRPPVPRKAHRIGLIACGGITAYHLAAYKHAGWDVVAVCDVDRAKAEARRKEFYPRAAVYTEYSELLKREDIDVVDIATYPAERPGIMAALNAGKHVLSQKPFVLDLAEGRRLVKLAEKRRLKLAVNQNGRWAPHFSWMRHAVAAGLIGQPFAAHLGVHWDHNWIKDKPFNNIRHILLYDFAIHWFDILTMLLPGQSPSRLYASFARSPSQQAAPNLLAQVLIEYPEAQATLSFDADVRHGQLDTTYIAGSKGSLRSAGPDLGTQSVELHTKRGVARPMIQGHWFLEGFTGTMAELLCAIEQDRQPNNSAEGNLNSLALAFAAIESAETHRAQVPGKIRRGP